MINTFSSAGVLGLRACKHDYTIKLSVAVLATRSGGLCRRFRRRPPLRSPYSIPSRIIDF